ncbi:MAG TPA: response regulator [Pirellulaceae bacterium]|nr:response regulator [Pirellulaceae bacterium]
MNNADHGAHAAATPTGPTSMVRMLLVDDDDALRDQLARAFRRRGFAVGAASNAREALELVEQETFALGVLDLRMPGDSGMKLLAQLLEQSPDMKIVMLTGFGSIANAVEALRLGAVNYVSKPAHADEILAAFALSESPPNVVDEFDGEESPSLAQAEWEHIQRTLKECNGNISQAARRLNISRRSLQRKLRKRAPD